MEIKIKGKSYKMKYTLRAIIVFEKITKKAFSLDTYTDQLVYFYSLLLANNPEMSLTMDELINAIDEDSNILEEYLSFLKSEKSKENLFSHSGKEEDKKKG